MALRPEMESIMSTASNVDHRELTETELEAVSGGDLSITKVLDQPSSTLGYDGGGATPTSAWNTLLYQYGYLK
jgi:bacteriocin-like protein